MDYYLLKGKSLGNKIPYELAEKDEDVQCLMKALKMHIIPADDMQLTQDIFKK